MVAIGGTIAAGKTTLTELLSEELDARPYNEKPEDNPFLAPFYDDMQRWGFHSQHFFLVDAFERFSRAASATRSIMDRSFDENFTVFATSLKRQNIMHIDEYDALYRLYHLLLRRVEKPSLFIYLHAPIPVLMKRIKDRGRYYEGDITPSYLEGLERLYTTWIHEITYAPVLIVNSDQWDFVDNEKHKQAVVRRIKNQLTPESRINSRGIVYYL